MVPFFWATCPPKLAHFAEAVVASYITFKSLAVNFNVWVEAINLRINGCICSKSIFSSGFSLAYALCNFCLYLTIEAGPWGVRWCNGRGGGERVRRVISALWTCFLRILLKTTSGLKDTGPVNLKAWQIVVGLKIWLQNDWNIATNSSLSNFSSFNRIALSIASIW